MQEQRHASWSEGEADNVEAAIADALVWMEKFHQRVVASGQEENARRLAGSIRQLAKYGCNCIECEGKYMEFGLTEADAIISEIEARAITE